MLRTMVGGAIVAMVLASGVALAQNGQGGSGNNNDQGGSGNNNSQGTTRSVPEFDPAAIGAVGALVAGGGLLLARRRNKS